MRKVEFNRSNTPLPHSHPPSKRLLGVDVTGTPTEGQLQIDQSALTGESLPVSKGKGDTAYSSSICKQGQMMGVVTKTGINTYIGRAANLISITTDAGHFQKVINTIGNFLIIITVIMAVIILLVDIYGPPHVYEDFYGDATNDPEERAFLLPNGTKVDFTNSLYGNISNVNDDYSHATYKLIPGSNLAQLTQYGWDNTSWTANITSSGYTTPLDQTNIFIFNYPSNTSSPPSYWAFPLSTTTITINALPLRKYRPLEALKQVIVLIIAAIPVGLPTVLSVTMAVGASQLAKKKVIVKRLTAIEELASVSVLCSDKTGTLTMNQLSFDEPYLAYKGATNEKPGGNGQMYDANDILLYSYIASEPGATDPIEFAVRNAAEKRVDCLQGRAEGSHEIPGFKVTSFTPFNPHSKYTEARVRREDTGEEIRCIKGAPQVIIALCGGSDIADKAVIDFAKRGLRALGVARTVDAEMQKFEIVGLISLLDPPRADSAKTIRECKELGIQVKMITGDQTIIAKEVAHRLGMHRTILDAHMLIDSKLSIAEMTLRVERADGFAQVIPEHKYRVVELLQDKGYLVGMTGDGVNDAPALKKANVGIAVEGCTDAARSAADIVLLAAGLSTIVDGVKTSRAIFQRMRSYALYRIASTIHFLLFFFTSILIWGFTLPDTLIILIAVLNDAATLVISVDNARINRKPDKWRLGQLITLSFILGFLLCLISYGHFLLAKYYFFVTPPVLQTIMYLQISSCPHFVIFSTRLTTNFWKNVPSWKFTVAVGGTQVFAMFVSIFGLKGLYASAM